MPNSIQVRVNLGVALAHEGRLNEAASQYRKALELAPDNPVIELDLALAQYKQGQFEDAAAILERLHAEENRASLQVIELLSDCYLHLGRYQDVVTLLKPLHNTTQDNRAIDFALAMAFLKQGKVQESQPLVNQLMNSGDDGEVLLLRGASQLALHDSAGAVKTIQKALEKTTNLPGGCSLLGRALLDSGDHAGAQIAFEKAIDSDANDYEANLYLGGMLRFDGKPGEARPYLQRAIALRPNSIEGQFQIALLDLAEGNLNAALPALEAIERHAPDFQEVHVQLATLYARLHRTADSQREQAKVIELNENARKQTARQ